MIGKRRVSQGLNPSYGPQRRNTAHLSPTIGHLFLFSSSASGGQATLPPLLRA
jgi:hypothetical protein